MMIILRKILRLGGGTTFQRPYTNNANEQTSNGKSLDPDGTAKLLICRPDSMLSIQGATRLGFQTLQQRSLMTRTTIGITRGWHWHVYIFPMEFLGHLDLKVSLIQSLALLFETRVSMLQHWKRKPPMNSYGLSNFKADKFESP